MVNFKRKKNTRQRGTHTHGCGSKKKRRGAGNRGGRGDAGSGKRGDAKKPSYWAIKNRFGKNGFTSKSKLVINQINLVELQSAVETYIKQGKAELKADTYIVNLKDIKRNKLLGTGKLYKKFEITTEYASETAVKKVQEAGGKVILLKSSVANELEK